MTQDLESELRALLTVFQTDSVATDILYRDECLTYFNYSRKNIELIDKVIADLKAILAKHKETK